MWPSDPELIACLIRGGQLFMKNQPQQANCERMKKKLWPHEDRKLQIKEFQISDTQQEEEQAGHGEEKKQENRKSTKQGIPIRRETQSKALKNDTETGNRKQRRSKRNKNRRKSKLIFLILIFYCLKFEHFNSVIVNMSQIQCPVTQTNSLQASRKLTDLYFKCNFVFLKVGLSCVEVGGVIFKDLFGSQWYDWKVLGGPKIIFISGKVDIHKLTNRELSLETIQ